MGLGRSKERCLAAGAAASVALAGALVPLRAGADTITSSPLQSMLCTLSSMSISTNVSIGLVSTTVTGLTGPGFNISGSGTCQALNGSQFQLGVTGAGVALGTPTCADFVSTVGNGQVLLNGLGYPASFYIAGPVASGQWVMVVGTPTVGSEEGGVAELYMDPATLTACASGTTTLDYAGTMVLAYP